PGGTYWNVTQAEQRIWTGLLWESLAGGCSGGNCVLNNPTATQTVTQPAGTNFSINNFQLYGSNPFIGFAATAGGSNSAGITAGSGVFGFGNGTVGDTSGSLETNQVYGSLLQASSFISAVTPTTATSNSNISSPLIVAKGSYWTGSASAADSWTWEDMLGTGANPTSTYTLTHAGSTGAATVIFPAVTAPTINATTSVTTPVVNASVPSAIFTNTQANLNSTFNINDLDMEGQFHTFQGATNYSTEAASFGMAVPSTATVYQTNTVGAYLTTASTTSNAVSGYFSANPTVAGAKAWGINGVTTDNGLAVAADYAGEFDCNLS
ncbi:MAG: hypothetical protein ACYCOU_10180, partial [Sulfobacillus sp.]